VNGIARPDRDKFLGVLGEIPRLLARETETFWALGERLHQIEELTSDRVRNRCADQLFGIKIGSQQNYLRIYRGWPDGNIPKHPDGTTYSLTECLTKLGYRKPKSATLRTDGPAYVNVLRGDSEEWKLRKAELLELVLDDSSAKRDVPLYGTEKHLGKNAPEQSIFDPYLAEILYDWYCPAGGLIVDPFAGLPVRGCVAYLGGYEYLGYELDPKQAERNQKHCRWLRGQLDENDPVSHMVGEMRCVVGDAREIESPKPADFLIACPPYLDREPYSKPEDPWHDDDLSSMSPETFTKAYDTIIERCLALLKPDRFAAFVVADVRPEKRNPNNALFGLVSLTETLFAKHGAELINKAAYVTPYGTAPQRMAAPFENRRILTSVHQTVLVFCKGNPKVAAAEIRQSEIESEARYERYLEIRRIPVAVDEKRQLREKYA
jgi:hypothetical protein